MTHITVTLPIGAATFARCHADVFDADTLTVTSVDTGREIQVFGPDRWLDADATDDAGNPVYHFINSRSGEIMRHRVTDAEAFQAKCREVRHAVAR